LGAAAVPVFCVVYALANYRITTSGLEGRTMAGISWAVAVILYGVLAVVLSVRRKVLAITGTVAVLLLAAVSGIAQQLHIRELASVWREEKAVLARVPTEQIRKLPRDAEVQMLYLGPSYDGALPIFAEEWEITGAVFSLPALRDWQSPAQRTIHIHPAPAKYNWSWDGAKLTQYYPGHWKTSFAGSALYLWMYDDGRILPAAKGFSRHP
jgi:hypothetical protein